MSKTTPYDIKQKLLSLQNELLKNASQKQDIVMPDMPSTNAYVQKEEVEPDNLFAMLKDLQVNQQKILDLLVEINRKLK